MLKNSIYILQLMAVFPIAFIYFEATLYIIRVGSSAVFDSFNFFILIYILPFSTAFFLIALLLTILSVVKTKWKNNIGAMLWFIIVGLSFLLSTIFSKYFGMTGTSISYILFETISDTILILLSVTLLIHNEIIRFKEISALKKLSTTGVKCTDFS